MVNLLPGELMHKLAGLPWGSWGGERGMGDGGLGIWGLEVGIWKLERFRFWLAVLFLRSHPGNNLQL